MNLEALKERLDQLAWEEQANSELYERESEASVHWEIEFEKSIEELAQLLNVKNLNELEKTEGYLIWMLRLSPYVEGDSSKERALQYFGHSDSQVQYWAAQILESAAVNDSNKTLIKWESPCIEIPDGIKAGIERFLYVKKSGIIENLSISVDLRTVRVLELSIHIITASKDEIVLCNRLKTRYRKFYRTFTIKNTPKLNTLKGQNVKGKWHLKVINHTKSVDAQLIHWKLNFKIQ